MATVPRTIRVPISAAAQTVTFELAPGLAQFVQAVYAEIDTSSSGDTTPELSISEQAGVPIAVIPQGAVIDGGGSGRATWALRLDDDAPAATPLPPDVIEFNKDNQGGYLAVQSNAIGPSTFGTILYDSTGSSGTTGGIWVLASHRLTLQGDNINFNFGNFNLQPGGGNAPINWNGGAVTSGNKIYFRNDAIPLDLLTMAADGTFEFRLGRTAAKLRVLFGTQALFEVRSDGSLHGKTGQALTFDL